MGFALFTHSLIHEVLIYGKAASPMVLLSYPLALSSFTPFAPIFCYLPYAISFCRDVNADYHILIASRIGTKRYGMARSISVALSGGIVMGIIFSVTILLCVLFAAYPDTAETVDFMRNTTWARAGLLLVQNGLWVYLGRIALAFLFGALWALVGLAISTISPNRYVVLVAPFAIYQILWYILGSSMFNPLHMLRADLDALPSIAFVLIHQIFWLAVLFMASYLGIRRKCKNA
ncbi:MAG: hypothetical protein RR224_11950 [Clostridia bacterium]